MIELLTRFAIGFVVSFFACVTMNLIYSIIYVRLEQRRTGSEDVATDIRFKSGLVFTTIATTTACVYLAIRFF